MMQVDELNEEILVRVDKGKFWPLAEYKHEFGDPKKNHAKVVEVKMHNKVIKGVVMYPEEQKKNSGPIDCVLTSQKRVSRRSNKHGNNKKNNKKQQ